MKDAQFLGKRTAGFDADFGAACMAKVKRVFNLTTGMNIWVVIDYIG